MNARPKGRKAKLFALLKTMAPVLVAIPAVLVLFWTFRFAGEQLETWAENGLEELGQKILTKTERLLNTAHFSVDLNASWIESNLGQEKFGPGFYQLGRKEMGHFSHFGLIYYGDQGGHHWLTRRDPDQSIRQRIIERLDDSLVARKIFKRVAALPRKSPTDREVVQSLIAPILKTSWYAADAAGTLQFQNIDPLKVYDPRLRPWYKQAQHSPHGYTWTDVYTWEQKFKGKVETQTGITISMPVIKQGRLMGVTAIDLVLSSISDFLAKLEIGAHGQAVIFDSKGRLVGHPHYQALSRAAKVNHAKNDRIDIRQTGDEALTGAYAALRRQLHLNEGQAPLGRFEKTIVRFNANDNPYLSYFKPLDSAFMLDWYVGVLMPESDVTGELEDQFTLILTAVVVIFLLLFSVTPFYLKSQHEQAWIRDAFSKYVSPNRVEYLLEHPDHLTLGGEYRTCSFVMTDLVGFTSLMEQCDENQDPQEVVNMLNEYLEGMVEIAFRHEGTLDRIVGDAVAVLFSAPVVQENHAEQAMSCAMEMDRFATAYSQSLKEKGIDFGLTRIGVNTGKVLLGNFGGKHVFDYRALGDAINSAARLESVNTQLGTRLCVSSETINQLKNFRGRKIGDLVFKGKSKSIATYEPLTETEMNSERIRAYQEAYALMAKGDPNAEKRFVQALKKWPYDPLLQFHHVRLSQGEHGERVVFKNK
ncbi:MAG: hypothetical protein HQL53_08800 [Magnetococcales bacterium]|nr:hypothetical protein [Magnetococcales bacterium]